MNKDIFCKNEGNQYFKRNINNLKDNNDIILKNLDISTFQNKTILEIGCSNGWRLNELYKINNNNTYYGIEPSKEAINFGKDNFTNINFINGTCDKIDMEDNSCDIIMIPFVLMYIDRNLLFRCISEIDRVLKNNGILIITDFYSNRQRKNIYKHSSDTYIYKQNYFEIFISSHNYFLTKLECFTHNTTNMLDNYDDTCFYVELVKDNNNLFN